MEVKPHLRIIGRDRTGERRYPLEVPVVRVGRASDNELSMPDLSLSRVHAQVVTEAGRHFVEDLNSRNGTYLNDEQVEGRLPLVHGDEIRLGETTLIYQAEAESGVRLSQDSQKLTDGTVAIPAKELLSQTILDSSPPGSQLVEALSRASHLLISRADWSEVAAQILDVSMQAVDAERGALMVLEGDPPELQPAAIRTSAKDGSLVLSSTIAHAVVEERTSLITTDAQEDPRFDGSQSISLQGVRSAMCAPLWNEERVTGLIYLDRRLSARQFSEADLGLVTMLCNLTAAKLENVRLFEEAQEKRKLEHELSLAADIQRKLLPEAEPALRGWELAATSIPSRSIGGDMFDFIETRDGRLGLVVADVSGKGVSAALLMASLQANLRAFSHSIEDLAEMMVAVNDALARSSGTNKFATVFYGELDPQTGVLRYVNGGHNPGLIVRRSGELEELRVGGMIVGAFKGLARYEVGEAMIGPEDTLVLYSDGVTEAEGPNDTMFGDDGLAQELSKCVGCSAAEIRGRILDAIDVFSEGLPPSDDTTILVARRL